MKNIIFLTIFVIGAVFNSFPQQAGILPPTQPSPSEMVNLGIKAENEKKYSDAAKWYQKAANKGNAVAQFMLGNLYYSGLGVPEDEETAFRFIYKSAQQGYAPAQACIGVFYIECSPVPDEYDCPDYDEEALKWLRKSAAQGNEYGQLGLGHMYYYGNGVEENKREAFKLYSKSAEQGNATAQLYLGNMYEEGDGVQLNYDDAVKWYKKALANGESDAKEKIRKLEDLISRTITVSGQVHDSDGETLIGCAVMCEGTKNMTSTDLDGNWVLYNVDPESTIVFSYVGMETKKIKLKKNQTKIDSTFK